MIAAFRAGRLEELSKLPVEVLQQRRKAGADASRNRCMGFRRLRAAGVAAGRPAAAILDSPDDSRYRNGRESATRNADFDILICECA